MLPLNKVPMGFLRWELTCKNDFLVGDLFEEGHVTIGFFPDSWSSVETSSLGNRPRPKVERTIPTED